MAVFGRITRNDVRKAVKLSRSRGQSFKSICATCLLAVVFTRIFGKPYVMGLGNTWPVDNPNTNLRVTITARRLMDMFDAKYDYIDNVDKLYKQLKEIAPGKIQLIE